MAALIFGLASSVVVGEEVDGIVWIPHRTGTKVTRIDPATNSVVDTIEVGPGPFVLNEGFGDIWAPSYGGADVRRIRVG